MGGTSTCWMPFFAWMEALILAAAAAAAAAASCLSSPVPDPSTLAATAVGLRSRCGSESLRVGERDRLSKRDFLAGSVWSKRDRLRASSVMVRIQVEGNEGERKGESNNDVWIGEVGSNAKKACAKAEAPPTAFLPTLSTPDFT